MKYRLVTLLVCVGVFAFFSLSTLATTDQSGRVRNAPARSTDVPTMTSADAPTRVLSEPGAPSTAVATSSAPTIAWSHDFDSAVSLARADQVIVVDVYTDWCSWCKYMDKRVFTDPAVRSFAENNVFVKVNAEDGGSGQQFARRAKVRAFPTLLLYSQNGKLLGKHQGAFRTGNDLMAWIKGQSGKR